MRALRRPLLATLVIAAAVLSAGTPVKALTNASAHIPAVSTAFHSNVVCPAGTNWDNAKLMCD